MASPSVLQSQQSVQSVAATGKDAGSVAAIGMWAMEPQEVLSLSPRTASVFRVTRGRIWACARRRISMPNRRHACCG